MLQLPAFPLAVAVPFPQVFFVISYLPTHSLSRESEKSMDEASAGAFEFLYLFPAGSVSLYQTIFGL